MSQTKNNDFTVSISPNEAAVAAFTIAIVSMAFADFARATINGDGIVFGKTHLITRRLKRKK